MNRKLMITGLSFSVMHLTLMIRIAGTLASVLTKITKRWMRRISSIGKGYWLEGKDVVMLPRGARPESRWTLQLMEVKDLLLGRNDLGIGGDKWLPCITPAIKIP
jgi:hypothetical protein